MLFLFTACQKIDMDNKSKGNSNGQSSSNNNGTAPSSPIHNDNTGSQEPAILPDGTIQFQINDHVAILKTYENDDITKWLLISLYEWGDTYSAFNESKPWQAQEIAEKYLEGNLTGWRIPTREEAKAIKEVYNCPYTFNEYPDTLIHLNNSIVALKGYPINAWEAKNDLPAHRYLCEDATYTFSLKAGSNITTAGAKTKYNLRLVKDTTIAKLR